MIYKIQARSERGKQKKVGAGVFRDNSTSHRAFKGIGLAGIGKMTLRTQEEFDTIDLRTSVPASNQYSI
ncbi:hypothetical protein P9597_10630 [Aneurinibacillus migulanus]|uniref:hypothetical protein n=1 Tax=Aneurinibacillus migulanus TaxID=47500 RepID=UPI002E220241|nr:hypothetical protein [Aneurinibacillus migulanus]